MPSIVPSRARDAGTAPKPGRNAHPPAKKPKLSQAAKPPAPRQNGLSALLNGSAKNKPVAVAKINGIKPRRVNETTTVVGAGTSGHDVEMKDAQEVISISSGESSSDISSSEEEAEKDAEAGEELMDTAGEAAPVANGHTDNDEEEEEKRLVNNGTAEPEEPSFGERLQAQDPESAPPVVDVESAFAGPDTSSRALANTSTGRPLSAPSALSLGTNLTQALRTNDQAMMESVFTVTDVDTIYATVERLPSPLVGSLLEKLAEQISKRPGRASFLMIWVQWALACHGGYLANDKKITKQLASLNRVLKERASGLIPLLALKGRLDMLKAQLEIRRRNQKKAAAEDEDTAVIYVEGEEDEDSVSGDDGDAATGSPRKRLRQDSDEDDDEDSDSSDEMPTTMEGPEDSEDGSEDSEDLLDDEAEETENDTGDDMSEPMSDDDMEEGDDISGSEEEEAKPVRRSTAGRARY